MGDYVIFFMEVPPMYALNFLESDKGGTLFKPLRPKYLCNIKNISFDLSLVHIIFVYQNKLIRQTWDGHTKLAWAAPFWESNIGPLVTPPPLIIDGMTTKYLASDRRISPLVSRTTCNTWLGVAVVLLLHEEENARNEISKTTLFIFF